MGKYQGYPEYKDSETEWLGEVPAHWQILPTKRFFRLVAEPAPCNNNFELLSVYTDIGVKPRKELEQKGNKASTTDGYWLVNQGDIVVNKLLAWMGALGHSNYDGVTSPAYDILRKTKDFNSRFYHYLFRSDIAKQEFKRWSRGIMEMRLRLYFDELGRIPMPFPPKEEIESITNFLDHETAKIDTLIDKQQQLIKLLKEKRQAVISHAVTKGLNPQAPMKDSGVEWLGEVPEHWGVSQVKYAINPDTSITYGIVQAGPHIEDGIPYIKTSDMSGDELPLDGYSKTSVRIDAAYKRSKVFEGDIVVAIRASVGKSLLVPKKLDGANLTQGTAKISCGLNMLPKFLLAYLNSVPVQGFFSSISKGATFKEITLDSLRRLPTLVPPLPEQEKLIHYIENHNEIFMKLIKSAEIQVSLLKERRTALISAAVTGKIDVRNWQAPTPQSQAIEETA